MLWPFLALKTFKLGLYFKEFDLAGLSSKGDHICQKSGFVITVVPCMAKVLAYQRRNEALVESTLSQHQ